MSFKEKFKRLKEILSTHSDILLLNYIQEDEFHNKNDLIDNSINRIVNKIFAKKTIKPILKRKEPNKIYNKKIDYEDKIKRCREIAHSIKKDTFKNINFTYKNKLRITNQYEIEKIDKNLSLAEKYDRRAFNYIKSRNEKSLELAGEREIDFHGICKKDLPKYLKDIFKKYRYEKLIFITGRVRKENILRPLIIEYLEKHKISYCLIYCGIEVYNN